MITFTLGVSFLNIGSGTGYMSTMAGLLIGPYGINHGIELYAQNVEFAQERQEDFIANSPWYDPALYCEPLFVVGNGLLLSPGNLLYDRIYCGAGCPPQHAQLMKNMLAVGGILVMPHGNQVSEVLRFFCTLKPVFIIGLGHFILYIVLVPVGHLCVVRKWGGGGGS